MQTVPTTKKCQKIFIEVGIHLLQVVTQILYNQDIYTLTYAVRKWIFLLNQEFGRVIKYSQNWRRTC